MKNLTNLCFLFFSLFLSAQTSTLFVGTYTSGASEGVYTFEFNSQTGTLSNKKLIAKEENPSFIAFTKDKQHLYVLNETSNFEGASGSVSTYRRNGTQEYQKINTVSTNGAHPCHIALNQAEDQLAISNYTGGNISLHEISKGLVQPAFQIFEHNTADQKANAHMAHFEHDKLFGAFLGGNFIKEYTKNPVSNYFESNTFSMMKGAGPRHFKFTKDGHFMYVINELNSTISVLKKSADGYVRIQNFYTTASDYSGENSCADIHISDDEQFVYGSNRGENSIVVFKRDLSTGRLSKVQTVSTHGNWPRNFAIDPSGSFMLVANERSNNIAVYNIDKSTGELTYKSSTDMPSPVCLLF